MRAALAPSVNVQVLAVADRQRAVSRHRDRVQVPIVGQHRVRQQTRTAVIPIQSRHRRRHVPRIGHLLAVEQISATTRTVSSSVRMTAPEMPAIAITWCSPTASTDSRPPLRPESRRQPSSTVAYGPTMTGPVPAFGRKYVLSFAGHSLLYRGAAPRIQAATFGGPRTGSSRPCVRRSAETPRDRNRTGRRPGGSRPAGWPAPEYVESADLVGLNTRTCCWCHPVRDPRTRSGGRWDVERQHTAPPLASES